MKIICNSHTLGHPEIVTTLQRCYLSFSLLENDKSSFKLSFDRDNFINLLNVSFGNNTISEQLKKRFSLAESLDKIRSSLRSDKFEEELENAIGKNGLEMDLLFESDNYLEDLNNTESFSYNYIKKNLVEFDIDTLINVFFIFKKTIQDNMDLNKNWNHYQPEKFTFSEDNIFVTSYFQINGELLNDVKKQVRDYVLDKIPYFVNDLEVKEKKYLEIQLLIEELENIINQPDNDLIFPLVLKINKLFYAY